MKHLYLTLLSLLAVSATAQTAPVPDVVVTEHRFPIKGEIGGAIRREMDKARKDSGGVDAAGIAERMDEAFPFLDDYLNDPSGLVKFEIVSILGRERSERSLKLRTRYLAQDAGVYRSSIFNIGVRGIYDDYSPEQIVGWGGPALQRALFAGARETPVPQALLLLSCFGESARPQLNEIRKMHPNVKVRFGFEGWHPPIAFAFYCDLALAQTEEAAGLVRVKERLGWGNASDMAGLLEASKFLNTKPLLRLMVGALKDKRDFLLYNYAPDRPTPPPYQYTRICDIAWSALRFKSGTFYRVDYNPGPQPDAALEEMAEMIKSSSRFRAVK